MHQPNCPTKCCEDIAAGPLSAYAELLLLFDFLPACLRGLWLPNTSSSTYQAAAGASLQTEQHGNPCQLVHKLSVGLKCRVSHAEQHKYALSFPMVDNGVRGNADQDNATRVSSRNRNRYWQYMKAHYNMHCESTYSIAVAMRWSCVHLRQERRQGCHYCLTTSRQQSKSAT